MTIADEQFNALPWDEQFAILPTLPDEQQEQLIAARDAEWQSVLAGIFAALD